MTTIRVSKEVFNKISEEARWYGGPKWSTWVTLELPRHKGYTLMGVPATLLPWNQNRRPLKEETKK